MQIADCRWKYSFMCGNTLLGEGLYSHIEPDVVGNDLDFISGSSSVTPTYPGVFIFGTTLRMSLMRPLVFFLSTLALPLGEGGERCKSWRTTSTWWRRLT